MTVLKRIIQNTGYLLTANVISRVALFVFTIISARYLGANDFGIITLALAIARILSILADAGLATLSTRQIARDHTLVEKIVNHSLGIKFFLSIMAFAFVILIANFSGYDSSVRTVIYIIFSSIVFASFSETFLTAFKAKQEMQHVARSTILQSFILLSGGLYAIKHNFPVTTFSTIYLASESVVFIYVLSVYTKHFTAPKYQINFSFWKDLLRQSWPFAAMSLCIMIYFRIDVVMLSIMKTNVDAGIYGVAYRFSEIILIVPSLFMTSIFPVLSKYFQDSKDYFVKGYNKAVKFMVFLSIPASMCVFLLAKPILTILFGQKYISAYPTIQILIFASGLMFVTMVLGTMIVSTNQQIYHLGIVVLAVFLNILLNFILIPQFSCNGAAAATVLTEAFGLFLGVFFLNKWGYPLKISTFKPQLAGLTIFCCINFTLLRIAPLSTAYQTLLFLVIYSFVTFHFGLDRDDKKIINHIFNKTVFREV